MAISTQPFNTQLSGIAVSTGAYDQTDLLRIPSVDPNFYYSNKGNMFYKLLEFLGATEVVDQPRHEFHNDDKFDTVTAPNADYNSSVTTVVVTDAIVIPRMVLYNTTTAEALYVTAVSGASLTVVRGHQGTTAAAIVAATDKLIILESSLPEGADAGDGVAKLPTKDYAVVSMFSETMSQTDLQKQTNMIAEVGKISGQFQDYNWKLMEQCDNALRWSTRDIDTSTDSDGTLYYTGGFASTVTTNDISLIGELNWQDFNDEFNAIFDQTESSPTKWLICGPTLYDKINKISWDHFVVDGTDAFQSVLGDRIQKIQLSGGGVIVLVRDPYGFSTAKNSAHKGFLIDPAYISMLKMKGFDLVWRDVTENKSHTEEIEGFGSCGLKIVREDQHATVDWTATA